MSTKLKEVVIVNYGNLSSPATELFIKHHIIWDSHTRSLDEDIWDNYGIFEHEVYPNFLATLANLGIAFVWEFEVTEDISYYAYNFPTEDEPSNLTTFKTGDYIKYPVIDEELRKKLETVTASNELLHKLGINNGKN